MEEKGIWIKKNGKLKRCYDYHELVHVIDTDCKIHIYRKDGYGIRFLVENIFIINDCILLDLLPSIKLKSKDSEEKYCCVINSALKNKNVDRLRIENSIGRKRKNYIEGLFFVEDTSADCSFWKDSMDLSLDGLKIVVIPESDRINDMKKRVSGYFNGSCAGGNTGIPSLWQAYQDRLIKHRLKPEPIDVLEEIKKIKEEIGKDNITFMNQGENNMGTLKNKIKKVIYVDKPLTVNHKTTDKDGNETIKSIKYNGMVKVFWTDGTETIAYTNVRDQFNKEEGFKTCVMKYVFGNAEAHESVDFWTNKYVKYPSSCIEVTEALCKLEKVLQKDKNRSENQKGLTYVKFFRETGLLGKYLSEYKQCHKEHISEFKKLAKKHFPEMKGKEIYINHGRKDEIFVAIK